MNKVERKNIDVKKIEALLDSDQLSASEYKELSLKLAEARKQKIVNTLKDLGNQIRDYCRVNEIPLSKGVKIANLHDVRAVPVKYRDPEDPSNVWAGRGRTPNWFKKRLKEGYTKEDLLVNN